MADAVRFAPFAVRWPLRTFLELGALPGAVPCARLHARNVLAEWGLTVFSESTGLLVSELRAGGAGPVVAGVGPGAGGDFRLGR
jgi:hypothetical protein